MADTTPEEAPEPKAAEATEIPAEPTDDVVTTRHTLTVKRKKLAYTAKAGRVVLRKEVVKDGKSEGFKAKAEVFLTSYTLDDADPGTRPVTFAFNGGARSSGHWLPHGPLRARPGVVGGGGDPGAPP